MECKSKKCKKFNNWESENEEDNGTEGNYLNI